VAASNKERENTMPIYTAYFRTDANFATQEFEADTPEEALRAARDFLESAAEDLTYENYDSGMPVNEIEIQDQDCEVAVWYDDDLRVRLAASDLLDALADQTEAAQAVIDNWAEGDLAAAVRELDASIDLARAAIAKAKGGGQ
jgi:hypothetical protein